jgi:hypothetical protein
MSPSASPIASSSRLSTTSAPPAKRPRPSDESNFGDDDGMSDAEPSSGDLDQEAREKLARKEARVRPSPFVFPPQLTLQTIRNRESAQRSRNQRKAHLVYLEQRVAELEAENRALLAAPGYSTPARASSPERECSPAQSVLSIAHDLGIAPEIVSSSGGVHLASVLPPPADLDVKPVIPASPLSLAALPPISVEQLAAENQGLKERVGLLTNLVRQLVALTNLDSSNLAAPVAQPSSHPWQTSAVAPTLSPNLFPTLPTQLPQSVNEMSLASHPAVMVTRASTPSRALQRTRNPTFLTPLEPTLGRLAMVAKVVIQLARLRGLTSDPSSPSSMWTLCSHRTTNRATKLNARRRHRLRFGMKG